MTIPFVDLKTQFRDLRDEIVPRVLRVMEDASFILGPDVGAFEENFANYVGTKHCIGVESGTAALQLALEALGIGDGDEVILPANTYIASAIAVSATGASPVLVDCDDAYLIDADALDAAVTPRTKAIMPVHLYGQAVPMEPILRCARRHGLRVVEDACQAHGARDAGRAVGSFGDAGVFSFYPGKNLGAYGDGGAVVTADSELAERVRLLRDFGQRKKYEHSIKAGNCRLDSIQAAVLDVKLTHLDRWNDARRRNARLYDAKLAAIGIEPPRRLTDEGHVYHLYVIEVERRAAVQQYLSDCGVATGIHYPIPIHLQNAYADLGLRAGSFPSTERAAQRILSLPMYPELREEQIDYVVGAVERSQRLVPA
ncbi:MAG: DegT/DnrJ/EryC1/StrS family aminotransferase [Candidatus Eremiobacteraeota bacterium]|nr:DegT/DnrJ/EryC1/StrS family aminotransferase [Candidatus Eremiobacteraeota bacterium]MBV9263356.1 DegT/DnrJ/EryC1/StrS family aminotransferase [Candidatus Eremiobacteraeota bacterium]